MMGTWAETVRPLLLSELTMRSGLSAAALALVLSAPAFAQAPQPGFDARPLQGGAFTPPPAPAANPAPTAAPADAAPAAATAAPAVKKVVKRAPPPPKERGIVTNDPTPSFTSDTARLTAEAATRYRAIADNGGWPILAKGVRLAAGAKGPQVLALRQRLAAEGDLPQASVDNPAYDTELANAVRQFQGRHGLARNGVVAGSTLAALTVTAETRARQLEQSILRMGDRDFNFGGRYVVVNIPSASVEAIEGNLVKRRYVAVVGKPENASPQVTARIGTVNINPTWTVPVSIIKNEIMPKMRKDPGYLGRANIRVIDRSGAIVPATAIDWNSDRALGYTLRQDSGARNSLGQIRIDMPNRDAVYMHDTPSKRFFASQDRFYSHGCVRVQDVKGFAAWLLEETPGGWDKSAIDAAIAIGERKDVRLAKGVPVAWVYMTGYVTNDGMVHFRDDVYSLDTPQAAAVAQVKRQQKQAAREAALAAARSAEVTASIPASGQGATQQMIDPQPGLPPRKGFLWW